MTDGQHRISGSQTSVTSAVSQGRIALGQTYKSALDREYWLAFSLELVYAGFSWCSHLIHTLQPSKVGRFHPSTKSGVISWERYHSLLLQKVFELFLLSPGQPGNDVGMVLRSCSLTAKLLYPDLPLRLHRIEELELLTFWWMATNAVGTMRVSDGRESSEFPN